MSKALLIGINKYHLPGNDLRGCINDVIDVKAMLLAHYGLGESDIRLLTDSAATKNGILDSLGWLTGSGDSNLILYYSGHGTRVSDSNNDETDRLDEALCPHDVYDERTVITDDTIASYISRLPSTARFQFVADCCHSGSIDRQFPLSNPHYRRAKFLVLPDSKIKRGAKPIRRTRELAAGSAQRLLLSGCRDDQTSADAWFNGRANGALSYFFLSVLRLHKRATWRHVHSRAISLLARNGYDQIPQLSGPGAMLAAPVFM